MSRAGAPGRGPTSTGRARGRSRLRAALTVVAAAAVGGTLLVGAPQAAVAAPADGVVITGHGWGHGRGMGQWGALGYATEHGATWQDITDHFYGGTLLAGDAGDPEVTVRLEGTMGAVMTVQGTSSVVGAGTPMPGTTAVRVQRVGPGLFQVLDGVSCTGTFYPRGVPVAASSVTVVQDVPVDEVGGLLGLCGSTHLTRYRGALTAVDTGTAQVVVNRLTVDDYLRGVLPQEMPATWGDRAGGAGMHALRAQAVAARSYALSESRWPYARTCDTTSCQVYRGAARSPVAGGTTEVLEHARTDQAVAQTSSWVRRWPDGSVVRTEFSSSTGGYSAGGVFPAVQDLGDAVAGNSNHRWEVTMSAADVAARLGVPSVTSLEVTRRNGLGDWGGRVLELRVTSPTGTLVLTGQQARTRLGLRSDWFTVSGALAPDVLAWVDALYTDFLGRPADAGGRTYWAQTYAATGDRQGVAWQFGHSPEWYSLMLDGAYRQALGRPADSGGLAFYRAQLMNRSIGLEWLTAQLWASDEALSRGGSVEGWVRLMYTELLRRPADDGGVAYWSSVARRDGRLKAAWALYQDNEAAAQRADALYRHLLARPADSGGLGYWTSYLVLYGQLALSAQLASSDEYYSRAQVR